MTATQAAVAEGSTLVRVGGDLGTLTAALRQNGTVPPCDFFHHA
jgi:hypothetical protein